jgi:hypothetical protein
MLANRNVDMGDQEGQETSDVSFSLVQGSVEGEAPLLMLALAAVGGCGDPA